MQLWSLNPVGAYVCIFMYFCVLCKYILCGQAAVVSMNRSGTSISLSLLSPQSALNLRAGWSSPNFPNDKKP